MSNKTEWINSGVWAEGFSVQLHGSANVDEFFRQYHACPEVWKSVFSFMKQDLSLLDAGKYPLVEGGAFAVISEYQTKLPEQAKWEAHKKYIDLQYVITGEEQIGVLPLGDAVDGQGYDETKDLIFYGENDGNYYQANPDVFFLFFPTDVHRPSMQVDRPGQVKKVVVKIAVAE